jgi:hypothetical protein
MVFASFSPSPTVPSVFSGIAASWKCCPCAEGGQWGSLECLPHALHEAKFGDSSLRWLSCALGSSASCWWPIEEMLQTQWNHLSPFILKSRLADSQPHLTSGVGDGALCPVPWCVPGPSLLWNMRDALSICYIILEAAAPRVTLFWGHCTLFLYNTGLLTGMKVQQTPPVRRDVGLHRTVLSTQSIHHSWPLNANGTP